MWPLPLLLTCASRGIDSSALRNNAAFRRGVFEKFFNAIREILFARQADVYSGDLSTAIDQERGGQRIDSAIGLGRHVVADDQPVIDAQPGGEGLHDFPAL